MMVQLGIFLAPDAEQAEVDQPDGAGHDPVPVEAAAPQVLQRGRPQRRERAGEPQHVGKLLRVSLLSPELVVAVLGPATAVHAGGLDMSSGSGEIQTLVQAGGMAIAPMRSSVSASVTSVPDRSRYRKPSRVLNRVMPGPRRSLRTSPGTAAPPIRPGS